MTHDGSARRGWDSDFPTFSSTAPRVVRGRLTDFIPDASPQQIRAWDDSIPQLQTEVREIVDADQGAIEYTAILEYELPLDSRRPDVILLVSGAVAVVELKGKESPSLADLDQAAAYARDLRCYHRHCADRPVHAVLVPTRAHGYQGVRNGVHVSGPDVLHALVQKLQPPWPRSTLNPEAFLGADAYCPLPTLVQAARELFAKGMIRPIHRARAATDPAVEEIARIVHEAARTHTRRLVLVTGVPGAGKTLVGLRTVHSHYLDDLAIPRPAGGSTTPAVFLSGNGPLVEVLQYELRGAGGGGQTFVRGVKDYVKEYNRGAHKVPAEHVIVFDEAQRAWDRDKVADAHNTNLAKSEPEHFIEFADRIPQWCVVVGLVGSGQEIHIGEEAGLGQWSAALTASPQLSSWTVHVPPAVAPVFLAGAAQLETNDRLNLDTEIRFHAAKHLHGFVERLLSGAPREDTRPLAEQLEADGYHLRWTRVLDVAKAYLRDRYSEHSTARFGMLASSKDRDLIHWGVDNDFQSTKRTRLGPWYGEGDDSELSCRRLNTVVTEFGAQGLELDAVLLAWGSDLVRQDGRWSNARARGYKKGSKVRDPFQLRVNSYRVLLTRGRDATVVYIPKMNELEETALFLQESGFMQLS